MVKEKKMSKSSIAVIILAVLLVLSLVLGLTGAWFTKNGNSGTAETNSFQFGSVGPVTITATAAEHLRYDATQAEFVAVNDRVLPGDKVLAGGLTFEYDHEEAGSEGQVWYMIIDQAGQEYVKSGNVLLAIDNAAGYAAQEANAKITAKTPVEVVGQNLIVKINNVWYSLNGDYDNTPDNEKTGATYALAKDSWQIPNDGEDLALNTLDGHIGDVVYNNNGTRYAIAVMQIKNVDATTAYAVLHAELAGILA